MTSVTSAAAAYGLYNHLAETFAFEPRTAARFLKRRDTWYRRFAYALSDERRSLLSREEIDDALAVCCHSGGGVK